MEGDGPNFEAIAAQTTKVGRFEGLRNGIKGAATNFVKELGRTIVHEGVNNGIREAVGVTPEKRKDNDEQQEEKPKEPGLLELGPSETKENPAKKAVTLARFGRHFAQTRGRTRTETGPQTAPATTSAR